MSKRFKSSVNRVERMCNNCGVRKITANTSCRKYLGKKRVYCGFMRIVRDIKNTEKK